MGIEPERDGLPVDEGQRLLEHERGEPLQSDRLLNDLVVPHEHAVPAAGKAVAGEPAHEEEEGQQGEGQDHRPGDQEPAGAGGDEQEQGDEAQHHRGHPELDPHPAVQLWSAERLAVAQELEGHPVEVVEAVVERVVAVVVAGRTAQTLVPLSWVGGGAETQFNIIKNERGDITIDFMYISSLMKEYYKQLYVHKFDNLDETDSF